MFKNKIVFVLAIFLFVIFLVFIIHLWFVGQEQKLKNLKASRLGLGAISHQSSTIHNQYTSEDVKTIQDQEYTYKLFRDHLKQGKIDLALRLMAQKNRKEYENIFKHAQEQDRLYGLFLLLEEEIVKDKDNCLITKCTYIMKESGRKIDFVKDNQGVWLISSL
ncbi:MAG: hypothetical protein ABIH87_04200 [bacterium]